MKVIPLPIEEQLGSGFTHRVEITYADLTDTASTAKTIAIFPESGTFPVGTTILAAAMKLVSGFVCSDATVTNLVLIVGDGGSTNRYLASTELLTAATEILAKVSATAYAYLAADTVDAVFTISGGSTPTLAELTAGEVWIYLKVAPLDQY